MAELTAGQPSGQPGAGGEDELQEARDNTDESSSSSSSNNDNRNSPMPSAEVTMAQLEELQGQIVQLRASLAHAQQLSPADGPNVSQAVASMLATAASTTAAATEAAAQAECEAGGEHDAVHAAFCAEWQLLMQRARKLEAAIQRFAMQLAVAPASSGDYAPATSRLRQASSAAALICTDA